MRFYPAFDDVQIIPKYSEIKTRKECDVSVELLSKPGFKLKLPIISTPMSSVTEWRMANAMDLYGGLGIIHRFTKTIDALIEEVTQTIGHGRKNVQFGVSIGIQEDSFELLKELEKYNVSLVCIDTAHGNALMMKEFLDKIRSNYDIPIMAGNVATADGARHLEEWGANIIRVGVGGGSVCETRMRTGVGIPTLASVMDCASVVKTATLVADGGIRNPGDAAKAIAAGASAVMLGNMIAGTDETPGPIITIGEYPNVKKFKQYYGSASSNQKGNEEFVEGAGGLVPYKGFVEPVLKQIRFGIQSAMSYTNSKTIQEFWNNAEFAYVSSAGHLEGKPHLFYQG